MENTKQRIRGKGDGRRCAKQKSKRAYGKKRKTPNKKGEKRPVKVVHNEVVENVVEAAPSQDVNIEPTETVSTASTEKVATIENVEIKNQAISGFRLIEMSILSTVLSILACLDCKNTDTLVLIDVACKKIGMSSLLKIKCNVCDFFSSILHLSRSN